MDRTNPTVGDPDALLPLGVRVAGLGLGSVDYGADTIILDDRAAQLFSLPAHQPIPRRALHDRIHPDDLPQVEALVARMLNPHEPDHIDVVHRVQTPDGSERWLSARKHVTFDRPAGDADRQHLTGLVAIMDVTPHKLAEQRVQQLMHEMNHRLKNLLTVVQSIARMTARTGAPEDFLDRFDARLRALSHNQDLMVSRGGEGVALGALVRQQLDPFAGGSNAALHISGPDLSLKFDAIQPIGLALHELGTNAMKYGALSVKGGRVNIDWRVTDDRFSLSWTESGGPAVVQPQRKGFGSTVLTGMTRSALEADVTLTYDPAGLQWSFSCDLDRVRAAGAI